jgi:hypothetical protein
MGWSALTSWITFWKTIIRYLKPDGLVRIDELDQSWKTIMRYLEPDGLVRIDELDQVLEDNYPLPEARWAGPH